MQELSLRSNGFNEGNYATAYAQPLKIMAVRLVFKIFHQSLGDDRLAGNDLSTEGGAQTQDRRPFRGDMLWWEEGSGCCGPVVLRDSAPHGLQLGRKTKSATKEMRKVYYY